MVQKASICYWLAPDIYLPIFYVPFITIPRLDTWNFSKHIQVFAIPSTGTVCTLTSSSFVFSANPTFTDPDSNVGWMTD